MASTIKNIASNERFGQYLKDNGIGVNEAGRLLGVSGAQVSNIISGTNFGVHLLSRIVDVFPELDLEWLITGKTKKISHNKNRENESEKLLPELLPGLLPNDKNGAKNEDENVHLNVHPDVHPDKKKTYYSEVSEQDPLPYKRTAGSCQTCHANERVIAALQAHINTLERELHRQQVINDEIQGRDSGQKRKVG